MANGSMDMMASGPGRTYRDGVLGSMAMASGPGRSFQDGVLGGCAGCGLGNLNDRAYQSGVLGDYLGARQDGVLGALDLKNPLLWAGVGVAALGAFLLLKKKPMKSNRRRSLRRNRRRARRR